MPQEFQVLRCFSCETFQVHQVKKILKWCCKICGEKQSVVKVYGQGSGIDCRKHVQRLNTMRGELYSLKESSAVVASDQYGSGCRPDDEKDVGACPDTLRQGTSKWSQYSEVDANPSQSDHEEDSQITTDRNYFKKYKRQIKRKAKQTESIPSKYQKHTEAADQCYYKYGSPKIELENFLNYQNPSKPYASNGTFTEDGTDIHVGDQSVVRENQQWSAHRKKTVTKIVNQNVVNASSKWGKYYQLEADSLSQEDNFTSDLECYIANSPRSVKESNAFDKAVNNADKGYKAEILVRDNEPNNNDRKKSNGCEDRGRSANALADSYINSEIGNRNWGHAGRKNMEIEHKDLNDFTVEYPMTKSEKSEVHLLNTNTVKHDTGERRRVKQSAVTNCNTASKWSKFIANDKTKSLEDNVDEMENDSNQVPYLCDWREICNSQSKNGDKISDVCDTLITNKGNVKAYEKGSLKLLNTDTCNNGGPLQHDQKYENRQTGDKNSLKENIGIFSVGELDDEDLHL